MTGVWERRRQFRAVGRSIGRTRTPQSNAAPAASGEGTFALEPLPIVSHLSGDRKVAGPARLGRSRGNVREPGAHGRGWETRYGNRSSVNGLPTEARKSRERTGPPSRYGFGGRPSRAVERRLARPAGLEPATSWFVVCRKETTGGSTDAAAPDFIDVLSNPRPPETTPSRYRLSVICQSTFAPRSRKAKPGHVRARQRQTIRSDSFRISRQHPSPHSQASSSRAPGIESRRRQPSRGHWRTRANRNPCLRQKHACFGASETKYLLVIRARLDFHNGRHVVAQVPQRADNDEVATFVGEKPRGSLVSAVVRLLTDEDHLFVCDRVGCVPHRRADVIACELRIPVGEIGLRCTFTELSQNQLHRHARPADHGLAQHDLSG